MVSLFSFILSFFDLVNILFLIVLGSLLLQVLIAAAVCTKSGKTIISRQFVEMTKSRIEGLLAAFPKLMSTGRQHTFVETDSVRYVYQPLEKLYMLLITTKASNILEDLETLRLFSKMIPEYCRTMEESEIIDNAFNLIFAFDEIVALGYRESVNLAQIRTFVEMDSHEEKIYQAVRKTQEREAKNKMREKAKELQRQKLEAVKKGGKTPVFSTGTGFGSNTGGYNPVSNIESLMLRDEEPSYIAPAKSTTNKAMKLGSKSKDVESFVDQLKNEGEIVQTPLINKTANTGKVHTLENFDDVHLRQEERLTLRVGRDGGIQSFELHGLVTLRISDEKWGRLRVQLENKDDRGIQLQTHPNVDKELFKMKSQIGLKNPTKPFPLNTDVGVLKWRYQTQEESSIPLTSKKLNFKYINAASENIDGGCDVNIEYELEHDHMELNDVSIVIPLPIGVSPVISDCDGEYHHDSRKNNLTWSLPVIDSSNKSGCLEFSTLTSVPNDFFPLNVAFTSKTSYADLKITDVHLVENQAPVKYSVDTVFVVDKYEIV
ncbi:Coatomer subunit delta, putative [Pediculus humanus corporis]|uniref:Coatomer subunit delta n=1 Tax=Pediculus humanus subsp. corporis TaxID=121224 RepID=E0VJS0_PEDHC|nr:Coatomer subunit delta, putative [Pediculus humanus corporis]EEB13626.1 Coatomer subunit delta, putative [Pediculus humanus corporis]